MENRQEADVRSNITIRFARARRFLAEAGGLVDRLDDHLTETLLCLENREQVRALKRRLQELPERTELF